MKVLNLLAAGDIGGIEILNREYAEYSSHENIFLFLRSGGCIVDEMKKRNKKVFELNFSKIDVIKSLKSLIKICKMERVDAIIVHHASPLLHIFAMIIKIIYPQIVIIAYAHGHAINMYGEKERDALIRKTILSMALKKADAVIAISKAVKKSLETTFRISDKKIEVLYNGVDINKYKPCEKKNTHIVNCLYVGRLRMEKGVQNILYVLSQLPDACSYQFYIIGDGIYRSELERLSEDLGLTEKVKFVGERYDVYSFLQKGDIFFHIPEWEEGFGITVIEAMATGLVTICGRSGALPEIVKDGINGFIVDKDDKQKIAYMVKEIIENMDNAQIEEIRKNARRRAEEFSMERYAMLLDDLIIRTKEKYI